MQLKVNTSKGYWFSQLIGGLWWVCQNRKVAQHSSLGSHLLGKVGKVLCDFGNQGQGAGGTVVWVFLKKVEQWWGHDGGAQEAQKQRGANKPLADIGTTPTATLLSPRCKDLLELPRENAAERIMGNELRSIDSKEPIASFTPLIKREMTP